MPEELVKRKLTKKQKGFVKDYIQTGNGELAAKNNYDIQGDDIGNIARSIASENLTKPNIVLAIQERLPDNLLVERHLELLNKKETVRYRDVNGNESIKQTEEMDVQAVTKGLDMAYKVKGYYAPEKQISLSANIDITEDYLKIAKEYEEKLNKLEDELQT